MPKQLLFACIFFSSTCMYAQGKYLDSSFISSAENFLRNFYYLQRGNESAIFSGRFDYSYPPYITGIPYFQSDEWRQGTVIYDDIRYENISMKYDQVKDLLIVKTKKTGGQNISLFSPRVKSFSLSGQEFIYIKKDATTLLPEGFYQQVVTGTATALLKTTKIIKEVIVSNELKKEIIERTKFYILKRGEYYPLLKKEDLLAALREHRKEVQRYLNEMNLKFRKDPQAAIIAATRLYNQKEN